MFDWWSDDYTKDLQDRPLSSKNNNPSTNYEKKSELIRSTLNKQDNSQDDLPDINGIFENNHIKNSIAIAR